MASATVASRRIDFGCGVIRSAAVRAFNSSGGSRRFGAVAVMTVSSGARVVSGMRAERAGPARQSSPAQGLAHPTRSRGRSGVGGRREVRPGGTQPSRSRSRPEGPGRAPPPPRTRCCLVALPKAAAVPRAVGEVARLGFRARMPAELEDCRPRRCAGAGRRAPRDFPHDIVRQRIDRPLGPYWPVGRLPATGRGECGPAGAGTGEFVPLRCGGGPADGGPGWTSIAGHPPGRGFDASHADVVPVLHEAEAHSLAPEGDRAVDRHVADPNPVGEPDGQFAVHRIRPDDYPVCPHGSFGGLRRPHARTLVPVPGCRGHNCHVVIKHCVYQFPRHRR